MTNQQAANIVAVLTAGFPSEALELETVKLWTIEVALLVDSQVGMEAARVTVREADRFPTIKDFRHTYRSIAERWRRETPAIEMRYGDPPVWVNVWYWSHFSRLPASDRIDNPFPQNAGEYAANDGEAYERGPALTTEQYEQLEQEWISAGSPRPHDMVQSLSGEVLHG